MDQKLNNNKYELGDDGIIKANNIPFDIKSTIGFIDGFVIKYSSTTAVAIISGTVEANGFVYTLASDTTHTMTSLASAFDFHYIYIDDDASTAPTAVIIDATTEPTWSDSKRGWYNGDDRCIGAVISGSSSATVVYFDSSAHGKNIENKYPISSGIANIATNMSPNGIWQTPNTNESSILLPVNAIELIIRSDESDASSICAYYATTSEMAAIYTGQTDGQISIIGYNRLGENHRIILAASRNIKVGGQNDDDNALNTMLVGYKYSR